eukprot:Skav219943  [mRNA]  locus=scaffold2879:74959:77679:- [translate_table: standard]
MGRWADLDYREKTIIPSLVRHPNHSDKVRRSATSLGEPGSSRFTNQSAERLGKALNFRLPDALDAQHALLLHAASYEDKKGKSKYADCYSPSPQPKAWWDKEIEPVAIRLQRVAKDFRGWNTGVVIGTICHWLHPSFTRPSPVTSCNANVVTLGSSSNIGWLQDAMALVHSYTEAAKADKSKNVGDVC